MTRWLRHLWSQWTGQAVSRAWIVEQERREFGAGVDQVCAQWPINKQVSEASEWNRYRLKKRA